MNYIKRLQQENDSLCSALARVEQEITAFQSFLQSAEKFQGFGSDGSRKDWIATADVIARLMEIRKVAAVDTRPLRGQKYGGKIPVAELDLPEMLERSSRSPSDL